MGTNRRRLAIQVGIIILCLSTAAYVLRQHYRDESGPHRVAVDSSEPSAPPATHEAPADVPGEDDREGQETAAALVASPETSEPETSLEFEAPPAEEPRRVAVLAADDLDSRKQAFSELLVQHLAAHETLNVVERASLDAVLRELEIASLASATNRAARLRTGELLGADLLVLAQPAPNAADEISLALIETSHGLRLMLDAFEVDDELEQRAEAAGELLSMQAVQSLGDTKAVLAVPVFLDQRIVEDRGHLAEQLAFIARQQLTALPQALSLEVEEAEALERELTLRGDQSLATTLQPFFLTGRIRADPTAPKRLSLTLTLERGGETVIEQSITDVADVQAAAFARTATTELMREAMADTELAGIANSSVLAQRLIAQAEHFDRVGQLQRAMRLIETAVLVDTQDAAPKRELIAHGNKFIRALGYGRTGRSMAQRREMAVDIYRQQWDTVLQAIEQRAGWNAVGGFQLSRSVLARLGRRSELDHLPEAQIPFPREGNDRYRHLPLEAYEIHASARDRILQMLRRLNRTDSLTPETSQLLFRLLPQELFFLETAEEAFAWRYEVATILASVTRRGSAAYSPEQIFRRLFFVRRAVDRYKPERARYYVGELERRAANADPALSRAMMSARAMIIWEGQFFSRSQLNLENVPGIESTAREELAPEKADEPEAPVDEVTAERVPLVITSGPDKGREPENVYRWETAGPIGDLLWSPTEVLLMPERNELRSLFRLTHDEHLWLDPERRSLLCEPVYEGRYVWTALAMAEPLVVVIDVETGETWQFGADDNVPGTDRGVSIAPLAPGKTIISGSLEGETGVRAWSAVARFSPEDGLALNVFREASSTHKEDRDTGLFALSTGASTVVTHPNDPTQRHVIVNQSDYIYRHYFRSGSGSNWVGGGDKLLIDPDELTFFSRSWPVADSHRMIYHDDGYFYRPLSNSTTPERWGWPDWEVQKIWPRSDLGSKFLGGTRVYYRGRVLTFDWDATLWGASHASHIPSILARNPSGAIPANDGARLRTSPGRFMLSVSRVHGLVATHYGARAPVYRIRIPNHVFKQDPPPPPKPSTVSFNGARYRTVDDPAWRTPTHEWTWEEAGEFTAVWHAELPAAEKDAEVEFLLHQMRERKMSQIWINAPQRDEGDPPMVLSLESSKPIVPDKANAALILKWPAPDADDAEMLEMLPGLKMVSIPTGEAILGGVPAHTAHPSDGPPQQVKIEAGLWMSEAPITQGQYDYVMGKVSKEEALRNRHPVRVSILHRARLFVRRLNEMTMSNYRLPTSEEWEYAARAGTTTTWPTGEDPEALARIAWCSVDGKIGSAKGILPVKSLEPNAWGFYDMLGNSAEWTTHPDYHDGLIRGGSWHDPPEHCRPASCRTSMGTEEFTFRIVLDQRDQLKE